VLVGVSCDGGRVYNNNNNLPTPSRAINANKNILMVRKFGRSENDTFQFWF